MNTTAPPPPRSSLVVTREVFRSARTEVRLGRTAEIARYRRERAFLDALAGPGIPAVLDLIEHDGTVRLVMAHQGGRSLADLMASRRLSTRESLDILSDAAAILARVHAAGVIHKDLAPGNLVWADRAGSLLLVDFGNSAREGESAPPGHLEGTLKYIAPEATGRSGHAVTWRTDLYGLGATAWHLLVGRPPFEDEDPLALVHAHLAREPEGPHAVDPTVPPCLSAVVLRLMEKDPERRYQSAEGLAADLRQCRDAIDRGDLRAFELATHDTPPRFAVPDRIYGRDAEIAALTSALDRAGARGVSLALVEGASGIGQSALVEQLASRGRRPGARVVRGRFEQLGRDTPLKAVSEACESLVAGLLTVEERTLAQTREHLRTTLGDAAGLLARTIPALRALLGDVAAAPELDGHAAAVRTMQAHAALLGALASPACPIVMFLDDLQWADIASLDLVEFLVSASDIHGLLILGGCRDDEVGPAHPLTRMGERIEAQGRPITRVRPGPLDLAHTTALVADACRCTPDDAAPLAAALQERTRGNPFFLRTLLQQMHDRGLLERRGTGWRLSPAAPPTIGTSARSASFKPRSTASPLPVKAVRHHQHQRGWRVPEARLGDGRRGGLRRSGRDPDAHTRAKGHHVRREERDEHGLFGEGLFARKLSVGGAPDQREARVALADPPQHLGVVVVDPAEHHRGPGRRAGQPRLALPQRLGHRVAGVDVVAVSDRACEHRTSLPWPEGVRARRTTGGSLQPLGAALNTRARRRPERASILARPSGVAEHRRKRPPSGRIPATRCAPIARQPHPRLRVTHASASDSRPSG